MSDDEKYMYKFLGAKGPESVDRLILKGTTSNPEVFVDVGGEIEMTEDEAKQVSAAHHVQFRRTKDAVESGVGDDEPKAPVITDKAAQQKAQAATTGTTPVNPGKSN